jgi:hypothetical protein
MMEESLSIKVYKRIKVDVEKVTGKHPLDISHGPEWASAAKPKFSEHGVVEIGGDGWLIIPLEESVHIYVGGWLTRSFLYLRSWMVWNQLMEIP